MGVLKNLTDEYFKKTMREEDVTPFDRYMKTVKWVDMGHPKFLFAENEIHKDIDYSSHRVSEKELFNFNENYKGEYELMDERVMKWLLENNSFSLTRENIPYRKVNSILVENKDSGNKIEISIDQPSGTDVSITTALKEYKTGSFALYFMFNCADEEHIMRNLKEAKIHRTKVYYDSEYPRYSVKIMKRK